MNVTGNENEFRTLFETGLNVNATDENGNTALMLAAERGDDAMISNVKNNRNYTARSMDLNFDFKRQKFENSIQKKLCERINLLFFRAPKKCGASHSDGRQC